MHIGPMEYPRTNIDTENDPNISEEDPKSSNTIGMAGESIAEVAGLAISHIQKIQKIAENT